MMPDGAPISFEDWKSLVGDTNALLLGLGAPVQRDDIGYNKADHGACLAAGLEPEGRYLADVAERLPKYHRQIGGPAVADRIKSGLDLYGDGLDAGRLGVSAVARDGRAMVFFKYHAAFVDAVKRLPARDRRFDRPSSAWVVSPAKLPELADLLEAAGANVASVRRLATQFGPSGAEQQSAAAEKLEVEVWEDGDELAIRHEFDEGLNGAYRAAKVYFDRGTKTRRISRCFNGRPTRFALRAKAVLDALRARQDVSVKGIELLESWANAATEEAARPQAIGELKAIEDILRPGIDLFGFQREGVSFIEGTGYRCIVGDDMGLGKTVQAIAAAARAGLRTLVVCPASLKYNWAREVAKFTGLRTYVATTEERETAIGGIPGASRGGPAGGWRECEFVVVNGDILIDRITGKKLVPSLWAEPLKAAGFGLLVVDESQYYKNWKAKRTKRLAEIAKRIRRRVLLTGTVIKSRPSELYSQLRLVAPGLAGKFVDYAVRFCGGYRDRFGFHADGATNLVRRTPRRDRPPARSAASAGAAAGRRPSGGAGTRGICGGGAPRYARAAADFLEYLREEQGDAAAIRARRAEHLTRITALRRLALVPKTEAAIEFARGACEQGEKVVIFSGFTEVTDAVKAAFGGACVSVTGADGAAARDAAVQAFQNDPSVTVFAGQYAAAGVGITLTASSKVVFVDEPWTPGDKQQAEDRCHRIGQAGCVNVYTLLASGTVDRAIHGLLEEKARVVAAVQDGLPTTAGGGDVLDDLIEMMVASDRLGSYFARKSPFRG